MTTLTKIDLRLTMFKEYLRYRIDHWEQTPAHVMRVFRETGMLYYDREPLMRFNQWLYLHKHEDLIV